MDQIYKIKIGGIKCENYKIEGPNQKNNNNGPNCILSSSFAFKIIRSFAFLELQSNPH